MLLQAILIFVLFNLQPSIDCFHLRKFRYVFLTESDVAKLQNKECFMSQHYGMGQVFSRMLKSKSAHVRRYKGYQLWKVHETNMQNRMLQNFWTKYGTEVWNINQDGIDLLIRKRNIQKAKDYVEKTNFTYNVMIRDVETAIGNTYRKANNKSSKKKPWTKRNETSMDWNRYHNLDDISDFLQYCLATYPDLVQIVTIGRTYKKRNIQVLRISNGNLTNRAIFVSAGFQGRDWISPAAITYTISKLLWMWDNSLANFGNIDWYFLPVANPDGFRHSWFTDRLWAKNRRYYGKCYGANLERNFGYRWGGDGSSDRTCDSYYRGPEPFSESETKAVRQFVTNIGPTMDAYITFGAYGQLITYPWGDADFITKNRDNLHKIAKKARLNVRNMNAAEYLIGSTYRLKLAQSGNAADWIQHDVSPNFVYSIYLKDQGHYGYLLPPDYIIESGEESYEIVMTVASGLIKLNGINTKHANKINKRRER